MGIRSCQLIACLSALSIADAKRPTVDVAMSQAALEPPETIGGSASTQFRRSLLQGVLWGLDTLATCIVRGTDSLAHLRSGPRGWPSFHPILRAYVYSPRSSSSRSSVIVASICTRSFRPVSMPVHVHSDPHESPPSSLGDPDFGKHVEIQKNTLRKFCRAAGAKSGTSGCKWAGAAAGCIADGSFFQSKGGFEPMDEFLGCLNATTSGADLSCSPGETCCTPYLHYSSLHKQHIPSTIVKKCTFPRHIMSAVVLVYSTW